MIRLQIDFEYVEGLAELYAESSTCAFVGNKEGELTVAQAMENLERYISTKCYGAFERLGIMKIFYNDVLVGFSMPREIQPKEYKVFKIDEDDEITYYRIGTVYVSKDYRGLGIMKKTIEKFQSLYKSLIWTCNSKNVASYKTALAGGLIHSHQVFVRENKEWEFHDHAGVIRVDEVFKSI